MTGVALFRKIQRQNFTDWEKLLSFLHLEHKQFPKVAFPLNLPLRLAQKMEKGSWQDPLLRQFLPTAEELHPSPLFLLICRR